MKTIIAGSREGVPAFEVHNAILESGFAITQVVSGAARGVDSIGEEWARNSNVPVKAFPANWSVYGKRAGIVRNDEMAQYAEALIAVWDGKSPGTANMIATAKSKGLKVHVRVIS